MRKIRLLRSLLLITPLAIGFAVAEVWLRRSVPFCGTTPFRNATFAGAHHELRPSFTTLYKGVTITTNRQGFRGPEWPERRPGVARVAFVGDSVTFGTGVRWADTFVARLEARWREGGVAAEALCCAVPGYDVDNVERLLVNRVLPQRPDVVVYVFVFNDVERTTLREDIPPDGVIDTLSEYPLRSATLQWLGVRARAAQRLLTGDSSSGWAGHVLDEFENGGRERLAHGMARMQQACAAAGATLVVAAYPHLVDFDHNPFRPIDAAAGETAQDLGLPFLDLAEAFAGEEHLARYWAGPFDSHPNGAANDKVAARLEQFLAPFVKG